MPARADRLPSPADDPRIHAAAIVEPGVTIGARTRIWAWAHILPGARIGDDCNICDHVFIENDVVIGDRVTVKCGIYLWNGVEVGDDVFLGPNVVFTNDEFPRSRQHVAPKRTRIEAGASVGANATVLPGITVGRCAMVGAGAVVTRDVAPFALVVGNPARAVGHVCVCGQRLKIHDPQIRCDACGRAFDYDGQHLTPGAR